VRRQLIRPRRRDGAGHRPGRRAAASTCTGRTGRRSRIRSLARWEGGFTLIELLVVIIVLGPLVGLVGPRLFGRVARSKQAAARAQIEFFGAALDQYRLDVGGYPTGAQGLDAFVRNPNVAS